MTKIIKNYLAQMYLKAVIQNHKNIISLLEQNKIAKFLDLGCDDGEVTTKLNQKVQTENLFGVEIIQESREKAEQKGIKTYSFDLNNSFDLESNSFDIVHANQVIEHIVNSDNFVDEIYRILKPGGYAVISTENASSWCNIFASIMGWQIFSLTNFTPKYGAVGNPLALHKDEKASFSSWCHIRIWNIYGLKEYFQKAGFKVESILSAGYFPLPGFFAKLDKTHGHFITYKIRKPR
jgi:2-polyprenyl-3-methyl-5-hydroxy-6-metoxy-1,4-benzoquinol methylase